MTKFKTLAALLALALIGTAQAAETDAAALAKLDANELCLMYHATKSPAVRDQLTRQHAFTRKTWWLIERGFPDEQQFMTYTHVVCMWGAPDKVTSEATQFGIKRKLTYNMDGRVYRVYLLGGQVQSYSEDNE